MKAPLIGLSMQVDEPFLEATRDLFAAGHVDVLEWTPEIGWGQGVPDWAGLALDTYANAGRLYGHSIALSPLSGKWEPYQDEWLARLQGELQRRRYRHFSEHFCWMNAGAFDLGAPLPLPRTPATLRVGCERMQRFRDAVKMPVGLENLAAVFSRRDVDGQGQFLAELLDSCDGFMVLDLHNLYCHAANFDVDPLALLELYPTDHVCELHVSGGSWTRPEANGGQRPYRRDTHDQAVPDEVFALVQPALARCPHVELVTFERIGGTLGPEEEQAGLRRDFMKLRAIVEEAAAHAR
jgi:uncharacterized protein (UPF0276 family)